MAHLRRPFRGLDLLDTAEIFGSAEIAAEWQDVSGQIAVSAPNLGTGSVNAGDRRAIFHLVRALKPRRLIEVGTHIGGSTLSIAAAMRCNLAEAGDCSLTTVDIRDVNDGPDPAWRRADLPGSPRDAIAALDMAAHVTFVRSDSATYFGECGEQFDFIFIDGSHTLDAVYRDVSAALRCAQPRCTVLLHDYFPGARPLHADGKVIAGPYMAVERLRDEGANIEAIPLGALPWPTKQGSNVTSLAILRRRDGMS